jgi:hypothetical protein
MHGAGEFVSHARTLFLTESPAHEVPLELDLRLEEIAHRRMANFRDELSQVGLGLETKRMLEDVSRGYKSVVKDLRRIQELFSDLEGWEDPEEEIPGQPVQTAFREGGKLVELTAGTPEVEAARAEALTS